MSFTLRKALAAALIATTWSLGAVASEHQPPRDFSAIQHVELRNELPGRAIPFFIKADEGERHLVAGMALSVMARGQDTGQLYEVMTWTGGKGAGLPLHAFATSHQALYVMDGQLELWLGNGHWLMNKGDYASIPPGVPFAFTMRAHRTKVLNWATGSASAALMGGLGQPYAGHVQPETAVVALDAAAMRASQESGELRWAGTPRQGKAIAVTNATLPATVAPYVLASGEGERFVAGDQVFTYLGNGNGSAGKFLAVMTEGPAGDMIPPHFHALHTEVFFPLEGTLNMIGNAQKLMAEPGDIVHIPAGTIHAYQMNRHYTKFIGFLTPGVFDDFFRTIGDPYQPHMFPQNPGPLRFDRVLEKLDELDLYLVGKPQ
ncbi:MAG TPA: quercetin 2,3-dioxygenase [Pseudoduganella sp.]|jgi:quercetin 2,3-dioxygenase